MAGRSAPVLELKSVTKRYGHVIALDRADLRANAGEVLAVVGDNGAGKTTMLKILAGVHGMDSGELLIDGSAQTLSSPAKAQEHGIATVFQNLALVECLDIAANMYLGRPLTRARIFVDRKRMIEGAANSLRELKVRVPSVRVPVGMLSGGQRQGVAIARAVGQASRIVLMDEPTAALGYRETQQVLANIRQLRERGVAVILISHDLELVFQVADKVQVMRLGRVQGVRDRSEMNRDEIIGLITGVVPADTTAQEATA